jgi:hypothetical protein
MKAKNFHSPRRSVDMASRIDDGADFMAHTVIHTMVVRMQHVADQTGKSIGLIYDLAADRIRFVEMGSGGFDRSAIFRVVTPRTDWRGARSDGSNSPVVVSAH